MKIFLRIVGVIVTLVVAFVLIGFLLPQTIVIERSIATSAPPQAIYPLVADLKRWPDWQAWNKEMDPTVTYTFSDPSVGEGASYEWKGEKLSTGKVAITGVEKDYLVDYTVDFADTGANPGTMKFLPAGGKEGDQFQITWNFQCDMGFSPIGRYMGLMMRGMLEKDFDTGLANLKKLAESEPPTAVPAETGATTEVEPAADTATSESVAPGSSDEAPATDPTPEDSEPGIQTPPETESSETSPNTPATAEGAPAEASSSGSN